MNPIAFGIGGFTIYWYSLFILLAFALGFLLVKLELKRHNNINGDIIYDYFFYLIPIVIVGARLYYVIFEWSFYKDNLLDIFKIWNGGLAIHGGVIAGLIFTIFYTRKFHINTFRFMDIVAPSLVLGQAIGRWGNFFNSEAYGPIISLEKLRSFHLPQFIIDGMYINGSYHHPTFFYESLTCLLCFGLLILIRKFYKNLKVGTLSGIYFIIYGTERFFVEGLRTDSLMLGNLKVAQLVSIIMVLVGIVFLIFAVKKKVPYIEVINEKKKNMKKKG